MEEERITAERFWNAWHKFPEWMKQYWPKSDTDITRAGEWTKGVIYPFVVTIVAPQLNCQLSLEENKTDFLFRRDGRVMVHMEHEDNIEGVYSPKKELDKLKSTGAPLKCLISYAPESEVQMHFDRMYTITTNSIQQRPETQWLFIIGVFRGRDNIMQNEDWIARKANAGGLENLLW